MVIKDTETARQANRLLLEAATGNVPVIIFALCAAKSRIFVHILKRLPLTRFLQQVIVATC